MALCGLLACGTVAPSSAQPTQAEIEASKKVAADAANKAVDAFRDGKYEDAIAGFQKADKAFHALKFVLYIARAQAKLGKLLAAKSTYEALIQEQLPAYAPPEFFTAQTDAKKELADLGPRIPTLSIQAHAGVSNVTLDGQPVAPGPPLAVDPGDHTIAGVAPDNRVISKKVTLQEREAKVETLEPPPVAPPPRPATAIAPATVPIPSVMTAPTPVTATSSVGAPSRTVPIATYLAYSVAGASLIAGAVLGGMTLSKKSEFDSHASLALADEGEAFAVAADVAFSARSLPCPPVLRLPAARPPPEVGQARDSWLRGWGVVRSAAFFWRWQMRSQALWIALGEL